MHHTLCIKISILFDVCEVFLATEILKIIYCSLCFHDVYIMSDIILLWILISVKWQCE